MLPVLARRVSAFVVCLAFAGPSMAADSPKPVAPASTAAKPQKPQKPQKPTSPGRGPHTGGHLPIGVRTLGAWLDDPSILEPGASMIALSANYWQSPAGSETDLPVADVAVGMGPRLQLQGSVPWAVQSPGGASDRSLGDMYFGAKLGLLGKPAGNNAVAVTPLVEVLSSFNTTAGERRVHWLLPVSAQVGTDSVRVSGSGGYYSRGAVFGGGALEGDVTPAVTLAASLSYIHSTQATSLVEALGFTRNQVDASGGAYITVSPRLAVFGSVGRTLSQMDADSTRLLLNAGVAITFGKRPDDGGTR